MIAEDDYTVFWSGARKMIAEMFTRAISASETESPLWDTSNVPRIVPVDLIDVKTPDGRLIHLNKMLVILPVGDSGLLVKIYAFFAFDAIGNTIYYIPNREAREKASEIERRT